jgi:hypothetical protein
MPEDVPGGLRKSSRHLFPGESRNQLMNASMLLKFLPMLVMLVSLAYAAYTVQWLGSTLEPVLSQSATKQPEIKGAGPDSAASRSQDASPAIADTVRDLFQVVAKPGTGDEANGPGSNKLKTVVDPITVLLQGLTLNATLLRGRTQLAVINGRIYNAGQHLEGRDGQPSPLSLTKVFASKVVIEAEGKHYVLAYPTNFDTPVAARESRSGAQDSLDMRGLDPQLALIQALLKSPLGGLGASLLGKGGRDLILNAESRLQGADGGAAPVLTRPTRTAPGGSSSSP